VAFFLNFVKILCDVLSLIIVIRIILSWFAPSPTNRLNIILFQITEPLLSPLRRVIPRAGMFDFTPLAAIVILQLISNLLP
jgi:YggT family protein